MAEPRTDRKHDLPNCYMCLMVLACLTPRHRPWLLEAAWHASVASSNDVLGHDNSGEGALKSTRILTMRRVAIQFELGVAALLMQGDESPGHEVHLLSAWESGRWLSSIDFREGGSIDVKRGRTLERNSIASRC